MNNEKKPEVKGFIEIAADAKGEYVPTVWQPAEPLLDAASLITRDELQSAIEDMLLNNGEERERTIAPYAESMPDALQVTYEDGTVAVYRWHKAYYIAVAKRNAAIANPLAHLDNDAYAKREDACEAIYDALYDAIDGESGCEMVNLPNLEGLTDEEYVKARDKYAADCREYIYREGYACHDGVTATVIG